MERIKCCTREKWEEKMEGIGFQFHHTAEGLYWDESAYYLFTEKEIDELENATAKLYKMCLRAASHVIENKLYDKLGIPEDFVPLIENSWNTDHPVIYGRFDLRYDGINPPKLLEFNADTPTALFEASIAQWFWLQDIDASKDQFNSIHEKLIDYWSYLKKYYHKDKLYFSCVADNLEDLTTVQYLRDCAIQAGFVTDLVHIEDIGYDHDLKCFLDKHERPIRNIFKLYPWEWMIHEEYGPLLLESQGNTLWTEPAWKMILSNKAILPILWELFPGHENLLPSYFEEEVPAGILTEYVRKPKLSREGANIEICSGTRVLLSTEGDYGEEGCICQKFEALPAYDGNYPVIGSWIIGQQPAGIGIRESTSLITDNMSRFVPHMFCN
jgi:glutathionylspermidine synthase